MEDADIILYDFGPRSDDSGLPKTLPRELKHHASPSTKLDVRGATSGPLTIEEIVNSPVVSASNRREGSLSAPAWVIVLTAKDLRDRGYSDLSQALDDLPGMDIVRPYGDVYVKSYWRGYRPGSGADPYLVMLDGIPLNHLFFGDAQILATFPMTQIERIEIVYGPASAIYGRNAAMGIINVITIDGRAHQENDELGSKLDSRVTFGGPQRNLGRIEDSTRIFDATAFHITKDYRLRLAARAENAVLDRSIGDDFEYTKRRYYSDPNLWGQSVLDEYSDFAGRFRSPDKKRAIDARLSFANVELGAQLFSLSTGLGTRYPADRFQTQTPWTTRELSLFGRHHGNLSPSVAISTLAQFRQSDIASPSTNLYSGLDGFGAPGAGPNLFSVAAHNSALVVHQDVNIDTARHLFLEGDQLALNLGLKYMHSELSRNYDFETDLTFPLDAPDPIGGAVDNSTASARAEDTRLSADDLGVYLLAKYMFPAANAVHLGGRVDHSTITDSTSVTFRGGYAGTFDGLTIKLLYGQATYAPTAYDLRNAEALEEELSQTLEANLGYTFWKLALHADGYYVKYTDPIFSDYYGARNLEDRQVIGADFGARLLLRPVHLWAYYSRYFVAEESSSDSGELQRIGDLAFDKIWAGITFEEGPFAGTLLGRWVGPREPVASNPLGTVPSFFVLDANVVLSRVFFPGMWLGFRVANLLDAKYSHPGMATAGSGNTPSVIADGSYVGSQDEFNSRHPQPRRSLLLTVGLEI